MMTGSGCYQFIHCICGDINSGLKTKGEICIREVVYLWFWERQ